jgi:hypothetical protein
VRSDESVTQLTKQLATAADEPGNEWAFAVVTPVELSGPVPVVSLVRGKVERAIADEIGQIQDDPHDNEQPGGKGK